MHAFTAPYLEFVHEVVCCGSRDNDAASTRADEAFLHGLVDEGQQVVVVPINIQQSNLRSCICSARERESINIFICMYI